MKFEVPKIHFFEAYIIHWHGPSIFVVGEAKKYALVEKGKRPWQN